MRFRRTQRADPPHACFNASTYTQHFILPAWPSNRRSLRLEFKPPEELSPKGPAIRNNGQSHSYPQCQ